MSSSDEFNESQFAGLYTKQNQYRKEIELLGDISAKKIIFKAAKKNGIIPLLADLFRCVNPRNSLVSYSRQTGPWNFVPNLSSHGHPGQRSFFYLCIPPKEIWIDQTAHVGYYILTTELLDKKKLPKNLQYTLFHYNVDITAVELQTTGFEKWVAVDLKVDVHSMERKDKEIIANDEHSIYYAFIHIALRNKLPPSHTIGSEKHDKDRKWANMVLEIIWTTCVAQKHCRNTTDTSSMLQYIHLINQSIFVLCKDQRNNYFYKDLTEQFDTVFKLLQNLLDMRKIVTEKSTLNKTFNSIIQFLSEKYNKDITKCAPLRKLLIDKDNMLAAGKKQTQREHEPLVDEWEEDQRRQSISENPDYGGNTDEEAEKYEKISVAAVAVEDNDVQSDHQSYHQSDHDLDIHVDGSLGDLFTDTENGNDDDIEDALAKARHGYHELSKENEIKRKEVTESAQQSTEELEKLRAELSGEHQKQMEKIDLVKADLLKEQQKMLGRLDEHQNAIQVLGENHSKIEKGVQHLQKRKIDDMTLSELREYQEEIKKEGDSIVIEIWKKSKQ